MPCGPIAWSRANIELTFSTVGGLVPLDYANKHKSSLAFTIDPITVVCLHNQGLNGYKTNRSEVSTSIQLFMNKPLTEEV